MEREAGIDPRRPAWEVPMTDRSQAGNESLARMPLIPVCVINHANAKSTVCVQTYEGITMRFDYQRLMRTRRIILNIESLGESATSEKSVSKVGTVGTEHIHALTFPHLA
jgi:hypothetical protein